MPENKQNMPKPDVLQKQISELQEDCSSYVKKNSALIQKNLELQKELTSLSQQHSAVVNSFYWKSTWPLRAAQSFIKKHIANKNNKQNTLPINVQNGIWAADVPASVETPLVSVIVPCYNHAEYLHERLDSIYNQTYTNIEVILLDDASTDKSAEILTEYANKYPDITHLYLNEKNTGKVFNQWKKGLSFAKGTYVWIAESDDSCTLNMLEELVTLMKQQSVMLAFARSEFLQNGSPVGCQEEYLAGLDGFNWLSTFSICANNAVNKGFAIKNIIPNASAVLLRNSKQLLKQLPPYWENMKLCGDWLFYLCTIRGGCFAYTNKATNYYRIHEKSTSLKIQAAEAYYIENQLVAEYAALNYKINNNNLWQQGYNLLLQHCEATGNIQIKSKLPEIYSVEKLISSAQAHRPNILMLTYSLQVGGGEQYPILAANELKKQGYAVTMVNCRLGSYNAGVRAMLDDNVPLIELASTELMAECATLLGADIIHSHHGEIDCIVAKTLQANPEINSKHVITLHGMYEAVDDNEREKLLKNLSVAPPSAFIYLSDKNLKPFAYREEFKKCIFEKIGNGLPYKQTTAINRKEIGVDENSFVLCIASRGIKEKGWPQAIEAVKLASETSLTPIELILLGDGPCYEEYKQKELANIHLLGRKENVREYIAACDAGIFPSYYSGESYPLFILECLMEGKPVIASDIGEIKNQIKTTNNKYAGKTIQLLDGKPPVEYFANSIIEIANNKMLYSQMVQTVKETAKNHDISKTTKHYVQIYNKLLGNNNS